MKLEKITLYALLYNLTTIKISPPRRIHGKYPENKLPISSKSDIPLKD